MTKRDPWVQNHIEDMLWLRGLKPDAGSLLKSVNKELKKERLNKRNSNINETEEDNEEKSSIDKKRSIWHFLKRKK